MSGQHAQFSPSASERWLNCQGSIRLSIGLPPSPESPAAIEGTNAHSLLERILQGGKVTPSFKADIDYTKEMHECVNKAVVEIDAARDEADDHEFGIEEKLDMSEIVDGDMWGTSDVVIAEEFGVLHVMDYKHGKKAVNARENTQGLAYLMGAAYKHGYNFESYKFSILQPRVPRKSGKIISSWSCGYDRLKLQEKIFRSAVALAKRKSAPIREGSWCWFCPASKVCPAKADKRLQEARTLFD